MASSFILFTPEQKGILGNLDEDGVVTFAIAAGEGASIRGTEMFNRMMQHFGDEVRAIHGVWRKYYPDRISTNVDKVNELTTMGIPLEEAIRHAWTTTRAFKLGFTRAKVIGDTEGVPGAFSKIDVLIER